MRRLSLCVSHTLGHLIALLNKNLNIRVRISAKSKYKMSAIVEEENEMEKLKREIRENSCRLRDLTPWKKRQANTANKSNLELDKNKRIYTLAKKELTNEAIQGLFKIYFSSHILIKLFWTCGIIVSVGLCSYLIVQTIMTYLNFSVNTTLRSITENLADFPKITICK
jgi:hypothetical protein